MTGFAGTAAATSAAIIGSSPAIMSYIVVRPYRLSDGPWLTAKGRRSATARPTVARSRRVSVLRATTTAMRCQSECRRVTAVDANAATLPNCDCILARTYKHRFLVDKSSGTTARTAALG